MPLARRKIPIICNFHFFLTDVITCSNNFSDTKTSAKQELAERTEAPKDVAVVSEKDGKRERKMTSKMEESTKDVTRSAVKPAKKGNLQTNGKRKKSSKKELPSASCLESVETLPDKSKKKKSKDASIKKATEKNKKDISHVADILMSSLMEEEDSNNSSSLKSGSQSTGDPKLASQLSLTSSRSSSPTPLFSAQPETATTSSRTPQSSSSWTPHLSSSWTPHSSSTWTPYSSSTWTPQSQPVSSSWTHHCESSWTQQQSQSHFSLWTPQPQQHPSSSWTSPQSSGTSLHSQEGGYQSSSSLSGEAVVVSMDIDRLQTSQTYQSSCRSCDQLKFNIETLQRQLYELQQTHSVYNTRLYQLEQQVTQMKSNIQGTVAGISGLQDQQPTVEVVSEILYNGFTKAQLEHDLPSRGWKSDAKWLLRIMFSLAELKGHSITGHHGSKKTGAARPPLENRDKLRVLYDIIKEKYPGRMITDINLVLADVVKPSAAGMSSTL
ncbi:uncharacterized protein LOC128172650 [Crassostrea angulata]|uniref:uncharacterized protein LOC128172650 n=1 Tax=Magallana angulata TaxID=2784310 RepID=UPI0022B150D1|nr:uncharacterized protein LOC128172650 [Crassostrea angulata]